MKAQQEDNSLCANTFLNKMSYPTIVVILYEPRTSNMVFCVLVTGAQFNIGSFFLLTTLRLGTLDCMAPTTRE